jgi:hypothetical protein
VVVIAAGEDPARALAGVDLADYEVEEFVGGPIWHVDGLRRAGASAFRLASSYLGTCHGFACGEPLGSVVRLDAAADAVAAFADRCLDALGLRDGAFHLEAIEGPDGPVFLEVGARVGGGEIPFTLSEVYGVDLVGDWFRTVAGEPPRTLPTRLPTEHAGFLMLPEPAGRTLLAREDPTGRIAHLYAAELPEPGHHFDGHGGYEALLGRFRYRGPSAKHVTEAIHETITTYRYELTSHQVGADTGAVAGEGR